MKLSPLSTLRYDLFLHWCYIYKSVSVVLVEGIVQDSTRENVGAVFVQPVVSSGGGGGAGPGLAGTLCTHSSQAVGCKLPSRVVTSHYTSHHTSVTFCSYTHTPQ